MLPLAIPSQSPRTRVLVKIVTAAESIISRQTGSCLLSSPPPPLSCISTNPSSIEVLVNWTRASALSERRVNLIFRNGRRVSQRESHTGKVSLARDLVRCRQGCTIEHHAGTLRVTCETSNLYLRIIAFVFLVGATRARVFPPIPFVPRRFP